MASRSVSAVVPVAVTTSYGASASATPVSSSMRMTMGGRGSCTSRTVSAAGASATPGARVSAGGSVVTVTSSRYHPAKSTAISELLPSVPKSKRRRTSGASGSGTITCRHPKLYPPKAG